jgi:transposase
MGSMTTRLEFTPEILKELNYQRYHHLVPLVQRRMEAIWLKAHQLPHAQIAVLVDVTENTIRDYFELYQAGGVEKLKEIHYYQPESELKEHIVSLEAYFREHPPATIKQAQHEVEVITGIKRSESQVREFLKKNSISVTGK